MKKRKIGPVKLKMKRNEPAPLQIQRFRLKFEY